MAKMASVMSVFGDHRSHPRSYRSMDGTVELSMRRGVVWSAMDKLRVMDAEWDDSDDYP